MKLCMITSYPPEKDGVGQYSFNLINSLKKFKKKLDITIITHEIKSKKEKNIIRILHRKKVKRSYFQIFEELKNLPMTFYDIFRTMEIIKNDRINMVHVQYEPGLYNLFYTPILFTLLKFFKIKKIITLHARDYFPLNIFHKFFLYNKADKIIVHTNFHKKLISNKKVIEIIPMGIAPMKHRIKYSRNIMYYGFLSPHKGVEFLLYAFKKVLEKFRDSKLFIDVSINPKHVEELEYKKKIENLAKKLGVLKNIIYMKMKRNEILKINAQIAVFPFTKTYSAAQSMSLLDCIAAGKAIIITIVPGISEIIKDGENGFIVPFENSEKIAEKILKLFEDKNMLNKISKSNIDLVRIRSWNNIAKITYDLYKKIK